MIKKILRELYLLPRGEQRALLLLSFLLILGIIARATVHLLPGKLPPGMEQFVEESRVMMTTIEKMERPSPATSVTHATHATSVTPHPGTQVPGLSPFSQPINLNTADSVQLLPLPGIGPVFAGRIIRYRNLLGGFISIDQLHEVYGLKAETIRLIREYIQIDSTAIRKISLDSASFRELLRHPYLALVDVKALVEFREFMGNVNSIQELYENHILPDSTLEKVIPYLQFRD